MVDRLKFNEDPLLPHHDSGEEQQQHEHERYDEEMVEWTRVVNSSRHGSRYNRSTSRPKFFEQQQSQRSDFSTAQKYQKNQIITTNFETPRDKDANHDQHSFLEFMDEYLAELNRSTHGGRMHHGVHLSSKDSAKDEAKEQAKLSRKI